MDQASELTRWRDHPQRRALTEEMHLRQMPPFAAPARVLQLVMYIAGVPADEVFAHGAALLAHYGLPAPPPGKYFNARLGELDCSWEQHTEIATCTFVLPGPFDDPFAEPLTARLPDAWLAQLPGEMLRATQVALLPRAAPEPALPQLARWFDPAQLVCCDLQGGEARLWSNFRVHEAGLGRILLQDRALVGEGDPSRLVQRLQELGNYRNLALLGLPVAQRLAPRLDALEQRLSGITRAIAAGTAADDALLADVSQLAAELAELGTGAGFRMSATRAYASIVAERLDACGVVRVPGHRSLRDFTERRLTPAVRTCESAWLRLGQLEEHTSWAGSLLRARVETALERQNAALLSSMDRRALLQLRLQQAVEGLSVIAIAYYATGLAGYLFKALAHAWPALDPNLATGVAAPAILLAAWLSMHRMRSRLESR